MSGSKENAACLSLEKKMYTSLVRMIRTRHEIQIQSSRVKACLVNEPK